MSGILCAQMGGLPNYLGSATLTVGYYVIGSPPTDIIFWGWLNLGPNPGAISPSTWADSGLVIDDLDYRYFSDSGGSRVVFGVTGYAPNAGWLKMSIGGVDYNRSAATYTYNGTSSTWAWDASGTGNPMGTTIGATKAVVWS